MIESAAALRASGVEKRYPTPEGELTVLAGVDLELRASESVAITGPSGSGKSTFLNILGTLERPSAGSVRIGGDDPFALGAAELAAFRGRRVGMIFQEHHLLPQLTALENVLLPTLAGSPPPGSGERATALLERVGLARRASHRPSELSGGERQRVAIARAMLHRPALVLADEPTGNLDRATAGVVAELLLALQREEGAALVVVTHSPELAARFQRRCEMEGGALIAR